MNAKTLNRYQLLFEEALSASGIGIRVETDNVDALKQHLYRAKKKLIDAGREDYSQLQFVTPHKNQTIELWIVKKGQPNE